MLIHEIAGPSGSTSALAIQCPDASRTPKPRPSPSISRQSAAIWFQPASTDSGATPSAWSGTSASICNVVMLVVIPALVAGIHLSIRSGAGGWLDAGDKPRHDRGMQALASCR